MSARIGRIFVRVVCLLYVFKCEWIVVTRSGSGVYGDKKICWIYCDMVFYNFIDHDYSLKYNLRMWRGGQCSVSSVTDLEMVLNLLNWLVRLVLYGSQTAAYTIQYFGRLMFCMQFCFIFEEFTFRFRSPGIIQLYCHRLDVFVPFYVSLD